MTQILKVKRDISQFISQRWLMRKCESLKPRQDYDFEQRRFICHDVETFVPHLSSTATSPARTSSSASSSPSAAGCCRRIEGKMEPEAEKKIQTRRRDVAAGCPSPGPHPAAPLRGEEEVVVEEVGSNRGGGRGSPCSSRLTPTTLSQPHLPPLTPCTRAALTPIEEHTTTTTTTPTLTLTLTPTHSPPTWPRRRCPHTTSTTPTSTCMEVGQQPEGRLPPTAKRRRGTSSTRR